MYYIYRITNKVNGKTYIGQHKYLDLNDKYKGSGKHHSEETRKKLSEAMKGNQNSKGKHWKLVDEKRVWY